MRPLIVVLALAACGATTHPPPWGATPPSANDEVKALIDARERVGSFRADAWTESYDGAKRTRLHVLVEGARDDKLRINVMSPAGTDVDIDLACDGQRCTMIDRAQGCMRTGTDQIDPLQRIFHVIMNPDDLLGLATGTPHMVAELGDTQSSVEWDEKMGRERIATWGIPHEDEQLSLEDELEIDRRDGHRDIVAVTDVNAHQTMSRAELSHYTDVVDARGATFRVPTDSRFLNGVDHELIVAWKSVVVNPIIPASSFVLQPPAGLPTCP